MLRTQQSAARLQLRHSVDGFERTQHPQNAHRFDGVEAFACTSSCHCGVPEESVHCVNKNTCSPELECGQP